MSEFVGLVYDPPREGFPYLVTMFNSKDMTKALVAQPVQSVAEGEALLAELSKGLVELAKKDGYT